MDAKQLYFSFDGRISRSTYWLKFFLPVFLFAFLLGVIDGLLGQGKDYSWVLGIYALIILYPAICVSAKRWHDRDKSAWWILIGIIPYLGKLWIFIECGCLKGTDGPNRFGEDPLENL
ncbi:MAG: DUF805 domain-containing protein [Verrucomicrobiota bacterium JB024]|jgi:uncharacterized membrane protein YhaH (DUF805 family)|nr:DUF805 domain-containing protein [Verrucomicrobiota bacterium JB024]